MERWKECFHDVNLLCVNLLKKGIVKENICQKEEVMDTTINELEEAIQKMKMGKEPGHDGNNNRNNQIHE